MIDKDMPLPDHTKKDYYECYAKIVLEELFPELFVNLQIEDRPDLQTNDGIWGVEVTNARKKESLNAEKLYSKLLYGLVRNKEGAIKRIERCGHKLNGGVLSGGGTNDSFSMILLSFSDKLNKLNGKKYKGFKFNGLFVFSDIYANDEMITKAVKDMQEQQVNVEKKFNLVFILVPGDCYLCNLDKGIHEIYPIKSEIQSIQSRMARELVEKYEEI